VGGKSEVRRKGWEKEVAEERSQSLEGVALRMGRKEQGKRGEE